MTERILAHRQRVITDENRRWWTLGAMCFALFMMMLESSMAVETSPLCCHQLATL